MINQGTGADTAEAVPAGAEDGILKPIVGASISVHCSPLPQLRLKENPMEKWKLFKQLYKHYSILCRILEQDEEFQISSFLNCVGPVGLRIYNTLPFWPQRIKKMWKL